MRSPESITMHVEWRESAYLGTRNQSSEVFVIRTGSCLTQITKLYKTRTGQYSYGSVRDEIGRELVDLSATVLFHDDYVLYPHANATRPED